ncbi:MAG TPA: 30S ribosomal protein S20 [Actinomycetota bacterium]
MANIKSQKKRILTNEVARQRNQAIRSRLKSHRRVFAEALESGDKAAAEAALRRALRAYDTAVSAGVLHRNNAANHKAKLQRQFNAA